MTLDLDNWHEDFAADPEEDYQRLLDSLGWTGWFGFSIWQCSPAKGIDLVERVRHDLPGKTIEVLTLKAEDRNFFDCVKALPNYGSIEVLFVKGFEQSIYTYEQSQAGSISEASTPCLISHLNLNQEQFHTQFKFFFVFLVPPFVVRPLRSPNLFYWRCGKQWETPEEEAAITALESEWERLSFSDSYSEYLTWTQAERDRERLEIQTRLEESEFTSKFEGYLLWEQALLFDASEEYEKAIDYYDQVLQFDPDAYHAWKNRGSALAELKRYEEAVASYDKALEFTAHKYATWNRRGVSLSYLGRYEEAIASYDKALKFNPHYAEAWSNRGCSLFALERYEEAIASYEKTIEFKPNFASAFFNKACCYALQNQADLAIEWLQQAIALDPKLREDAETDTDFDLIRESDRFRALMEE
jgi:tetratricopeptide (TPR) repeat protein